MGYIIFGVLAGFLLPIIFIILTESKKDNSNVVRCGNGLKILTSLFVAFLIFITVWGFFDFAAGENWYFHGLTIPYVVIFGYGLNVILSTKIQIFDDYFLSRNFFWRTKKYRYDEITGIKYRKGNEMIICYLIVIGKKKIEISNPLVNFKLIDDKLRKEGIFRKYPNHKKNHIKMGRTK